MPSKFLQARDNVYKRHPRLKQYDFNVIPGQGPGYAEFYSPDERDNPTPGRPTIEIRKQDLEGRELENVIAGDALHHMGRADPEFKKMREQYRNSMSEEAKAQQKGRYEYSQKNFGEKRPYDQWFEASGLDAPIRGHLFPDENAEFKENWPYSDPQKYVLGRMQRYLGGK